MEISVAGAPASPPRAGPEVSLDHTMYCVPFFANVLVQSSLLATPSMSAPCAIVGFMTILGLLVTLSPSRRTYEVKRPKDE